MLLWLNVLAELAPQLFDELARATVQVGRHLDRHFHELVAVTAPQAMREALAAHPQHRSRLRGRWNTQLDLSRQRGDFDFSAERRLHERDRHFAYDLVPDPPEERMRK